MIFELIRQPTGVKKLQNEHPENAHFIAHCCRNMKKVENISLQLREFVAFWVIADQVGQLCHQFPLFFKEKRGWSSDYAISAADIKMRFWLSEHITRYFCLLHVTCKKKEILKHNSSWRRTLVSGGWGFMGLYQPALKLMSAYDGPTVIKHKNLLFLS